MSTLATAVLEPALAEASKVPAQAAKEARARTLRDARNPRLENAIVHVIDHRSRKMPVLSDVALPVAADSILQKYLTEQIENVLQDPETAEAKFLSQEHPVARSCYRALGAPQDFIAMSKELAQSLWDVTGTDQRISPGSMIVCRFHVAGYRQPFLALFKIDPTQVLLQTISETTDHVEVSLSVIENALPTARERLQKAAIVTPQGFTERYDLLLLDRMVAKPAAQFWLAFLNTQTIPTASERTEQFYRGYIKARNLLGQPPTPESPALTPEEDFYLDTEVKSALARPSLDSTVQWVAGLTLSEPAKAVLLEKLDEELGVRAFATDPHFTQQKLGKRRIRGDCGILIEFDQMFEKKVFTLGPKVGNTTDVILHVPNLRWLK